MRIPAAVSLFYLQARVCAFVRCYLHVFVCCARLFERGAAHRAFAASVGTTHCDCMRIPAAVSLFYLQALVCAFVRCYLYEFVCMYTLVWAGRCAQSLCCLCRNRSMSLQLHVFNLCMAYECASLRGCVHYSTNVYVYVCMWVCVFYYVQKHTYTSFFCSLIDAWTQCRFLQNLLPQLQNWYVIFIKIGVQLLYHV